MSQLVNKLRRLGKGTAPPLGFQPRSTPQEPPLLFIAYLAPGQAVPQGAVGVLVDGAGKPVEELAPSTGNTLWGVSLEAATPQELSRLKELGCDFLLTSLESPAAALDTDIGRLVMVDSSLADSQVRVLEGIADAAVLDLHTPALSLRHLLECHRLAGLLRGPLLALVSPELRNEEVRQLAGAGVRGVISRASKARLQEWLKALASRPVARTPTPVVLPVQSPPPEEPE